METRVFESKFNVLKVPKPLTKAQMKGCKGGFGNGGYGSDPESCCDCDNGQWFCDCKCQVTNVPYTSAWKKCYANDASKEKDLKTRCALGSCVCFLCN